MTLKDRATKLLSLPWMPLPLSFLTGVVSAYAMAPASFWPLMFIGLSAFYVLYAHGLKAWGATLLGFFFALGYFMTGLWWIGNALLVDGNEFAWVWPISVIGLPTLLSFFTAIACGIAYIIAPPRSIRGFIAFIGCVGLAEWIRGHIFSGFPWNLYGYAWGDILPMAQFASIGGAYGLSLITIFWAALAGFLYIGKLDSRQKTILITLAVVSFGAIFGYGVLRLKNNPTAFNDKVQLQIVQPNIKQDMKWDPGELVRNFEKHLDLSRLQKGDKTKADTTIILWPETAIGPALANNETARDKIVEVLKTHTHKTYLLSGLLDREEDDAGKRTYFNSLGIFTEDGQMKNVYSKTHLVPLGEFIPFQDYIPLKPVVEFSGFERGKGPSNIAFSGIPIFSPLICYEIIFSGNVVSTREKPSEWIAAITNDGWYGFSAGPYQHFMHAVFRSIEEGLPVARSANTGISGLTDAYGRVLYKTQIYEDAVVMSDLPLKSQNATLFSAYGNGSYLLVVTLLILGCIGFGTFLRRN
jgi:apolipoprotein N-acyltransferase